MQTTLLVPPTTPDNVDVVLFHARCWDGLAAAWSVFLRKTSRKINIDRAVLDHDADPWSVQKVGCPFQEEICRRAGVNVVFVPVTYAKKPEWEEPPTAIEGRHVLIVDFSYSRHTIDTKVLPRVASLTILDHHKSARNDLAGLHSDNAVFDMDRSGAQMAWDWAWGESRPRSRIVDLIADRDLWLFRDPLTKPFIAWLASRKQTFGLFQWIHGAPGHFDKILDEGATIVALEAQMAQRLAGSARVFNMEGRRVAVLNTRTLVSDVGNRLAERDGVDMALLWWFNHDASRPSIQASVRSVGQSDRADCVAMARRFGGGGHHNAAGFYLSGDDMRRFLEGQMF